MQYREATWLRFIYLSECGSFVWEISECGIFYAPDREPVQLREFSTQNGRVGMYELLYCFNGQEAKFCK